MTTPKRFARPPLATIGDRRTQRVYMAVGEALSAWELTEEAYSHLFNLFISPGKRSFATRRAYGSIQSARGRKELVEASAEVFFRDFPSAELARKTQDILTLYSGASSRRNEFAHGVVAGHVPDSAKHRGFAGYMIGPSFWSTSKRSLKLQPEYLYNSAMIRAFTHEFQLLRMEVFGLCTELEGHFRAGPEEARKRY
jgi:hypothetical protein